MGSPGQRHGAGGGRAGACNAGSWRPSELVRGGQGWPRGRSLLRSTGLTGPSQAGFVVFGHKFPGSLDQKGNRDNSGVQMSAKQLQNPAPPFWMRARSLVVMLMQFRFLASSKPGPQGCRSLAPGQAGNCRHLDVGTEVKLPKFFA